jgi:hypothetical protein
MVLMIQRNQISNHEKTAFEQSGRFNEGKGL